MRIFFKPKFPTCIVNLSFLTFIFSFCVLQAKREGAEAGGLRAGGSRNAVYGDRVRQKRNEPMKRKLTIFNSPSPWTCFRVCTIYRCRTAATPCKDRVTVITFGSDVPFVKQSSAWRQVLRLHSRLTYLASLYKRNSFKQNNLHYLTFKIKSKK